LKLSQGEVHDFSGEVQNDLRGGATRSQGRCKTISGEVRTSPNLPSKSGHDNNILDKGPYLKMSKVACYRMKQRLTSLPKTEFSHLSE
jgi:hypothetical protein